MLNDPFTPLFADNVIHKAAVSFGFSTADRNRLPPVFPVRSAVGGKFHVLVLV
jgi:hypothetical protein